jgi:hypothetical protein
LRCTSANARRVSSDNPGENRSAAEHRRSDSLDQPDADAACGFRSDAGGRLLSYAVTGSGVSPASLSTRNQRGTG